ncbi:MAG: hypothetical protein N2322_01165 [Terrimicrobiaceae bacterium]|nr:hypothetical protein [Terrimicrobiaceae bacterium]
MSCLLAALLFASGLPFFGGKSQAPPIAVRLHGEGGEHEGPSFVTPIELANPPKKIFIRKVPIINEKDITAILPFSSPDGSLGCILKLDRSGAERIEQHTSSARDAVVVALINARVASAMRVDRKITDGIVTIASGFLPEEILALQARHPTMGKEKEFPRQKKEALASLAKARKAAAADRKKAEREQAAKKGAPSTP